MIASKYELKYISISPEFLLLKEEICSLYCYDTLILLKIIKIKHLIRKLNYVVANECYSKNWYLRQLKFILKYNTVAK